MNTTYAQQASPPHPNMHINSRLPASNEGPYRSAAPVSNPQYHLPPQPHPMSMSQAPQSNPTYDPYSQLPVSRPPLQELGHAPPGLPDLAPGTQPAVPEPLARSVIENGRKYELLVVQQPRRARMCGFGDKDRRPITPPPCVRLVITDVNTGKEVDCNEVDHGMFVLNVDLWDEKGQAEVNLVRHSAGSPSISATAATSYARTDPVHTSYSNIMPQSNIIKFEQNQAPAYNPYPGPPNVNYTQAQSYAPQYNPHPAYAPTTNGNPYPPQNGYSQAPPQQQMYYASGAGMHAGAPAEYPPQAQQVAPYGNQYAQAEVPHQQSRTQGNPQQAQGMFTRNLIGSLSASAFRLTDPDDRIGIWFVLQDLSVRTEGNFRLHFSFVNVGVAASPTNGNPPGGAVPMTTVNRSKAPVLAACFSDVFTVYSAKRFPGVVESTGLSKCFATQGIKIPIRKDGPSKGDKDKGDEDYDG